MSVSMYDISVGVYTSGITSLIAILKKAAESPEAATLPAAKLSEDMKDLTFNVQSACNTVTRSLKRYVPTKVEAALTWEDNEVTIQDLQGRAEKTLELLKGIDAKLLGT